MTNVNNLPKALEILEKIQKLDFPMNDLAQKYQVHTNLWEIAVKEGDGIAEQKEREILHTLTDQRLDLMTNALQLAKSFQSL